MVADRFGNVNSAYNFNGINNYIFVPDHTALKPSKISISVWVKVNDFTCTKTGGNPDMASIIFKQNTNDSYFEGYMIGLRTDLHKIHGLASNSLNATGFSNTVALNVWKHIVVTIDSNKLNFYENGMLVDSVSTGFSLDYGNKPLCFGSTQHTYDGFFNGIIDDIGIWNRILTQTEITALYLLDNCNDTILNDTTTYLVSSLNFQPHSPEIYFKKIDSLTTLGGCDSIIYRYSKFLYDPYHFTDTISVEDTLNIRIELSINQNDYNEIKIYPNPAKDNLWIDCGDYTKMNNYKIKLVNTSASVIWTSTITQSIYNINISNYSKGMYFLEIYDDTNKNIITRKIVLQ